MNYGFGSQPRGQNFNRNKNNEVREIKVPEVLEDYNDPEKVRDFLDNIDKFTFGLKNKISYSKLRKYYERIIKTLRSEDKIEKLEVKLQLEVGILIDYDIGREKKNENKEVLEKVKEFFDKTLKVLKNKKDRNVFEKNWEVLIAYARKNLGEN